MNDALPSLVIAHPPTLIELAVLSDRGLRLLVQERTRRTPDPIIDGPVILFSQVEAGPSDRVFEISWEVVVCFAVRGDPFPLGGPSTETLSRGDPTDAFMAWVQSASHAEPEYIEAMSGSRVTPAPPLQHWRISTSEALVDVAATRPPAVRAIE